MMQPRKLWQMVNEQQHPGEVTYFNYYFKSSAKSLSNGVSIVELSKMVIGESNVLLLFIFSSQAVQ